MKTDDEEEEPQPCVGELVEWHLQNDRPCFFVAHEEIEWPVKVMSGDRFGVTEVGTGRQIEVVYIVRLVAGKPCSGFVKLSDPRAFYPLARINQLQFNFVCRNSRVASAVLNQLRQAA